MDQEPHLTITFQPSGQAVRVPTGAMVMTALEQAGIVASSICGGRGICGKCKIKIHRGDYSFSPAEEKILSPEERLNGIHLACQVKLDQDTELEVLGEEKPEISKILTYGLQPDIEVDEHLQKIYVELPRPALENQPADLENIETSIADQFFNLKVPLSLLQNLSAFLRKNDFKITLVITDNHLLTLEEGDTSTRRFGVAFDLGTTTIVGTLVDLKTGEELAVSARTNPQTSHGADVISRIDFAVNEPAGLSKLQQMVIETINEIIEELAKQANVKYREIYEMTLAGNTTMNHLFLGVTPQYMGQAPYVPAFRKSQKITAEELGLTLLPQGPVITLPNISGYVGGDITAFILAFGLHEQDKMTLALDIGTNGEIVLGSRERLLCCSAAAGPAFEGGHISCGMRATAGAIEKVVLTEECLYYRVIQGGPAKGICGTGLIDLLAEMIKKGIVDKTGKIVGKDELPQYPQYASRIIEKENNNDFTVVFPEDTADHQPITITQKDVRELQLAKAAIAAGIAILMSELGITSDNIKEVLIAGAFGTYINKHNALILGLLPQVSPHIVKFVGNAASVGAKKFLLSTAAREEAHNIILNTEYIELSGRQDFQDRFAAAMFF